MARADVLVLACACMHVPGGGSAVEFVGTLQDADLAATTSTSEIHEHEGSLDHLHQTIHRYSDDIGKVLKTLRQQGGVPAAGQGDLRPRPHHFQQATPQSLRGI
jgi:hypothetical protein